jgi:hypothetical protein
MRNKERKQHLHTFHMIDINNNKYTTLLKTLDSKSSTPLRSQRILVKIGGILLGFNYFRYG